mmetsp:Transcript_76822/g.223033  ORF Transcript_76822/g.223033 Transcript_76822/m.223033 type:complete len:978 (-) Transcript_76822:103-3036(-)
MGYVHEELGGPQEGGTDAAPVEGAHSGAADRVVEGEDGLRTHSNAASSRPPGVRREMLTQRINSRVGTGSSGALGAHFAKAGSMTPQCRMSQVCSCGNLYKPDALFCRKCGNERQTITEGEIKPVGQPIWSWSGANVGLHGRSLWNCWGEPFVETRFLDRKGPFGQSTGQWNVQHWADAKLRRGIQSLYRSDAYHSFLDGSLFLQLLIYTLVYLIVFLGFAPMYWSISGRCGLEIESFGQAYYLSLETMVTIGYGVPDTYYNDCWEGAVVLTVQSLLQMFLNALVIGSVFVRITRPQARANTILFTEKAVIHEIDGSLYFMFQACETKHHDLLEAHIRCYCIRYDRTVSNGYQIFPMRLQHPDDQQGASLLMALPSKVVHRIDAWSPLSPTSALKELPGNAHADLAAAFNTHAWPEVPQRQVDADGGIQQTMVCTVCGESFPTMEGLRRHVNYSAASDPANGVPEAKRHVPWSTEHHNVPTSTTVLRQDIEDFLSSQYIEIVVLLEGVEPTTSCSVQARHSYLFPEDIVWDRTFADCIELGTDERACAVDLGRFHDLVALDPDDYTPSKGLQPPRSRDRPSGKDLQIPFDPPLPEVATVLSTRQVSGHLSKMIGAGSASRNLQDAAVASRPLRVGFSQFTQRSIREEPVFQRLEHAPGDKDAADGWASQHVAAELQRIGWATQQAAPAAYLTGYDATEEFRVILDEIKEGKHELAQHWDLTYLFVPGLFYVNWKHTYLRTMLSHIHSLGLDGRIAKLDTTQGVLHNAEKLVRTVCELYKQTGKRVLLVGHSKGACDAIAAVSRFKQSVDGMVEGILCLNSPIGGTALAGSLSEEVLNATSAKEPRVLSHLMGPEVTALQDLSHSERAAEMESFPVHYGIPIVTFFAGTSGSSETALSMNAHLMRRHAPSWASEQLCDGVVFAEDAHLPGSVRIQYHEEWDHADIVYERKEGAATFVVEAAIVTLLRSLQMGRHKSKL